MRKLIFICLLTAAAFTCLQQAQSLDHRRALPTPPLITGAEGLPAGTEVVLPPYQIRPSDGVDLIGDTVTVGTTWYDYQHNGQIGRMITKDDSGYIHLVWTNGLDQAVSSRHVYYNCIDLLGEPLWALGYPVESSQRAGFACLAVTPEGQAWPAFHQILVDTAHSATAIDLLPRAGAFYPFELPWYNGQNNIELIWPRIARKLDGEVLVFSKRNGGDGISTWALGTYDPGSWTITYTDQELTETCAFISNEAAASRVSNRAGIAYAAGVNYADGGWDIHAMIDDDGLDLNPLNWWNVTNFWPPDLSQLPDTLMADADTLRAYTDVNLFFDMEDVAHITFTTISYFTLEGGLSFWNSALIWHWSESYPNEFHLVADGWNPDNFVECGGWNFRVQRPSIGQDPSTGYLYCMYQEFDVDTTHLSSFMGASGFGMPSGEVMISVSTDGGRNWSVGTNVTNTITPTGAAPGQSLSETFPSMAEEVDDYCHLTYVLDYDAGSVVQTEGTATLNSVKYHRVPKTAISPTPILENPYVLHVAHMPPVEPSPGGAPAQPAKFALEQNVPNPFNPTTTIRFSLESLSQVELTLYSLTGERITSIASGVYQAGQHAVTFNASDLPSGVYFYRLEVGGRSLQKKMLLIK